MQVKNRISDTLQRSFTMRPSRSAIAARFSFRNLIILTVLVTCIGTAQYLSNYTAIRRVDVSIKRPDFRPHGAPPPHVLGKLPPWKRPPPLPCMGPRGRFISESPDDQIFPQKLEKPYPVPFTGSYQALDLPEEWLTVEGRYGPYGYNADGWFSSGRERVKWDQVDWGLLQQQCQEKNKERFPPAGQNAFNASEVRFRLRTPEDGGDLDDSWFISLREKLGFPKPDEYTLEETAKTALVLRTYGQYKYTEEDMLNVRSLVSEASLQSGGEYTVVLFVNIKNIDKKIFESPENYAKALDETTVPAEFRHLVVLWDENLLKSWYPKVPEHGIMYQITQALQLFALFYPEFDHHWQLEMDMRSLGHTLTMLRALDHFSRKEPRKQSFERASYMHMSATQGPYYPDFLASVNETLEGGASIWGPMRIPEIPNPIGPPPPSRPEDDNFRWGVGEPADLVVTCACTWSRRAESWAFKGWLRGPFSLGGETPRMMCPPAIQRASRQLLLAAHTAQTRLGLAVPSEATLPSFALWHGLKLSFPPLPQFRREPLDPRTAEVYYNGGRPGEAVKLASPPPDASPAAAKAHQQELADYNATTGGRLDDAALAALDTIPFRDRDYRHHYRGFATGEAFHNQPPRVSLTYGLSFWWGASFPRRLLAAWSRGRWRRGDLSEPLAPPPPGGRVGLVELTDLALDGGGVLVEHAGQIWAPGGWLHPVKTFGEG